MRRNLLFPLFKNFSSKAKYLRVSPSVQLLLFRNKLQLNQLNLTENIKIVNKYNFLDYLPKSGDTAKKDSTANNKQVTSTTANVQVQPSQTQNQQPAQETKSIDNSSLPTSSATKIPHFYFKTSCNAEELTLTLNKLNGKLKDNKLSIIDFVAKAFSELVRKDLSLRRVYDNNTQNLINSPDINLHCVSYSKEGVETKQIYNLTKSTPLEKFHTIKTQNSNTVAVARIFDYSNLSVSCVDQVVVPPSILSLTIGEVKREIVSFEDKPRISSSFNLSLTAAANAFDEETLAKILDSLKATIENPYILSL